MGCCTFKRRAPEPQSPVAAAGRRYGQHPPTEPSAPTGRQGRVESTPPARLAGRGRPIFDCGASWAVPRPVVRPGQLTSPSPPSKLRVLVPSTDSSSCLCCPRYSPRCPPPVKLPRFHASIYAVRKEEAPQAYLLGKNYPSVTRVHASRCVLGSQISCEIPRVTRRFSCHDLSLRPRNGTSTNIPSYL